MEKNTNSTCVAYVDKYLNLNASGSKKIPNLCPWHEAAILKIMSVHKTNFATKGSLQWFA